MEFFSTTSKIAFMQIRTKTFALSVLMVVLSAFGLLRYGLHFSLDFTGGTQVEIHMPAQHDPAPIKKALKTQFPGSTIQSMENAHHLLVKVPQGNSSSAQKVESLRTFFQTSFPKVKILQEVSVGPQIGKNLLLNGINALLFALTATLVYIALRFEPRFAIAAIAALMHDPIVTLGIFAWAGIEFDLVSLAGVLTVLGYSLNDTVVVYDRIRENAEKYPNRSAESTIDAAINETLSRTIITSGLTLLAVLALALFGGETLWGFSLTLIIGIVVGTYSSIYIAGAIALALGLKLEKKPSITPTLLKYEA